MNENNKITEAQLEEVVAAASEERNNGGIDMEKIQNETVVDENAPLDIAITGEDGKSNITEGNIKESFDVSEEEAMQMLYTLNQAKENPNYPVYNNLPESIKTLIKQFASENNIPFSSINDLARYIISEMISDNKLDKAFEGVEDALEDALSMPSITDLYSEHMKNIIENKIPETVEAIKDTDPDKAESLLRIKEEFINSYNFSTVINTYENNSRLRKLVRRYETEYNNTISTFNMKAINSDLKMPNIKKMEIILFNLLIREPLQASIIAMESNESVPEEYQKLIDLKIEEKDIKKFCILICRSCDSRDPHNVFDAAYMYYIIKNIVSLELAREAKTDFARELISNICKVIIFIREKEAEFYAANPNQSKSSKKSNKNKSGKS